MRNRLLALALFSATCAYAQNTIYRCGNQYTDEPCQSGKTVDILPTDGAHSMSGTRRNSNEAVMRNVYREVDKAWHPLTGLSPEEAARRREERRFKSIPRVQMER